MLTNVRRKYAFTELWRNETGFTLISTILVLIIITITLPLLIYLLSHIQIASKNDAISIQQFFVFLRNDTLLANNVYSVNNKIVFDLDYDEKAIIEQYGNVIRRQVDGRGHEIYVRNIKAFHIERISYGLKVSVTSNKGEVYEKTIAYYR